MLQGWGLEGWGLGLADPAQGHLVRGRNYTPPFLAIRHFRGEGGGCVYFEAPPRQDFYMPPLFDTPPDP